MRERVLAPFDTAAEDIFAVELQRGGQNEWVESGDFSAGRRDGLYEYTLSGGGWHVTLRFTAEQGEKETLSSFTVEAAGDVTVRAVRYPIVRCAHVSPLDNLLFSSAWGDNIERPTKTIRDVSTSTSIRFGQDYIRYAPNEVIYTYPAIMAMQYMVLHNPSESLYLASYSTSGFTETFHAKVTGKYSMELSVCHYPFARDESWQGPPCATAFLGGGWHASADLYRAHMQDAFPTPNTPSWVRDSFHGWAEFTLKRWQGALSYRFAELPALYDEVARKTGMKCLFVVGWHDRGHDSDYPQYDLHAPAGTACDVRSAMRRIHEQGGRALFYTNARLIDTKGTFYADEGHSAVVVGEDGGEHIEVYGTDSVYAVACPCCDAYTRRMAHVAGRIAGEFGVDGMFVDQIACNLDPFCYAAGHGHSKPSNNFLPGVEKELRGITEAARAGNPQFITFAEGCHERFGSLYDLNQGHGEEYTWQIGQSLPEQFVYTFPDRIVTGHTADKQQMYHSMAQMKPLDIKTSCYSDESNHEPLRRYMALREAYAEYFLRGVFVDDEGFVYDDGLRLFAKRGDKGICVCLWRPGSIEDTQNEGGFFMPGGYTRCASVFPQGTTLSVERSRVHAVWTGPLAYFVCQ